MYYPCEWYVYISSVQVNLHQQQTNCSEHACILRKQNCSNNNDNYNIDKALYTQRLWASLCLHFMIFLWKSRCECVCTSYPFSLIFLLPLPFSLPFSPHCSLHFTLYCNRLEIQTAYKHTFFYNGAQLQCDTIQYIDISNGKPWSFSNTLQTLLPER